MWDPVCQGAFGYCKNIDKMGRRGIYQVDLQNIRLAEIHKLLSVYEYLYTEDKQCAFSPIFMKQVRIYGINQILGEKLGVVLLSYTNFGPKWVSHFEK